MLEKNDWSDQEKFVWKKLVAGEKADFNTEPGYGGPLDPKTPGDWAGKENRVLRPRFLKTILLDEGHRKTLAHKKVAISGAWFTEELDLSDATLANFLALDFCRFEKDVDFFHLQTPNLISLNKSTFSGELIMDSLRVEDSLLMRDGAQFNEVILRGAKIGRQLNMGNSTFSGELNMEKLQVGDDLFMHHVESEFLETVNLVMAKIGGSLVLAGSQNLPSFNLTGARIDGEFRLAQGAKHATWQDDAKLTLRNARVRAIQDHPDAWPNHLVREGFTYDWLGGFSADGENDMADRNVDWYLEWLGDKQKSHSPQPYEQLANVLEKHGRKDTADDIRYEKKEQERLNTNRRTLRYFWLLLQKTFIGYGYRYEHTLLWVLGLITVGVILLYVPHCAPPGFYEKLIFCLDKFLPLVKFRTASNPSINLTGWVQIYFDFLQVMGYVLVSYLIAGLSGLTKK
ncbi:MAG: hypothetical protein ACE5G9_06445 [Nitrospinales bacterium]